MDSENVIIIDLDGTLISNSSEIYKQFRFDMEGTQNKIIKKGLKSMAGKTLQEILKLKPYFKYREDLIESLNSKKAEGDILYLVSENPGAEYFAPDNLTFDGIYSTIIPEIKEGVITGNILKECTKTEIVRDILTNYEGFNQIEVHVDGSESDKNMINYLEGIYGNKLEVYKYESKVG